MKKILASLILGVSLIVMAIVPVGAATPITFWSQVCPGEPVVKLDNSGYDNVYSWSYLPGYDDMELPPQGWLIQKGLQVDVGTYPDQNVNFPCYFTIEITGCPYITQSKVQVWVPRVGSGEEWKYASKVFQFSFPRNFAPRDYDLTVKIYPTKQAASYQLVTIHLQVVKSLPIGA